MLGRMGECNYAVLLMPILATDTAQFIMRGQTTLMCLSTSLRRDMMESRGHLSHHTAMSTVTVSFTKPHTELGNLAIDLL